MPRLPLARMQPNPHERPIAAHVTPALGNYFINIYTHLISIPCWCELVLATLGAVTTSSTSASRHRMNVATATMRRKLSHIKSFTARIYHACILSNTPARSTYAAHSAKPTFSTSSGPLRLSPSNACCVPPNVPVLTFDPPSSAPPPTPHSIQEGVYLLHSTYVWVKMGEGFDSPLGWARRFWPSIPS